MSGYIAASLLSLAVLGAIVAACSLAVLTYRWLLRRWMGVPYQAGDSGG